MRLKNVQGQKYRILITTKLCVADSMLSISFCDLDAGRLHCSIQQNGSSKGDTFAAKSKI
jgi:hypothetical protein